MIVVYAIVASTLLVFELVDLVISMKIIPLPIVPRTASPVGMQLATDQIINKIEEEEDNSNEC